VLICEDEGLTSLRLRSSLRKLGYEVVGDAKDGEAAVAAAATLAPDVILMDIRMPKLDGIAATTQIMREQPTAVVMITAHNDRELVDAAMRAGASAYLVKPVGDDQIEPAITEALRRFAARYPVIRDMSGPNETPEADTPQRDADAPLSSPGA
jgi:DNA-binding NarL/FixJ family response regulator